MENQKRAIILIQNKRGRLIEKKPREGEREWNRVETRNLFFLEHMSFQLRLRGPRSILGTRTSSTVYYRGPIKAVTKSRNN